MSVWLFLVAKRLRAAGLSAFWQAWERRCREVDRVSKIHAASSKARAEEVSKPRIFRQLRQLPGSGPSAGPWGRQTCRMDTVETSLSGPSPSQELCGLARICKQPIRTKGPHSEIVFSIEAEKSDLSF